MVGTDTLQHPTAGASKAARQSPQPQSKKDKKRQVVNDRLSALNEQMSRDKDRHYREELQKIQVDVNLVSRVDPYADRPLDEIDRERREREVSQTTNGANKSNSGSQRSLLEMAGPTFQEWIHELEDLVETRDYDMTTQKYDYERKIQDYKNTHAYRIEVAKREHKALSETLRDRLINHITSKKYRLTKEKEAIDISDSSALLLHPNQFSLTNPASPGGPHGKRNTRLRREMEELPGYSDSKKRKRNADDEGSPAPARRGDTTNATPFWQGDRLKGVRRGTAPVFSIEKLFTDKELSMTYNTAALAAHRHLISRRDLQGNLLPSPDDSDASNGEGNDDEQDTSAAPMERQVSHTTRSTRGGGQQAFYDDKMLGIEGLSNFELPSNLNKVAAQEPRMPPLIHAHYVKQYNKSESNTPAALSAEDVSHDIAVITVLKNFQSKNGKGSNIAIENGGRRLLETMSLPQRKNPNLTYVQRRRPSTDALADLLGVTSSTRDEPVVNQSLLNAPAEVTNPTAAPMSRQSSIGGVTMSRTGSGRGKRKA